MNLTIYHLKNCDTCKKAIKSISEAGHALKAIDVRADGIPAAELETIVKTVGYETLLNTRSTTWRGLSEADKAGVDEAKAIRLMSENPTLIKRPVIHDGQSYTVGWTKEVQSKYL